MDKIEIDYIVKLIELEIQNNKISQNEKLVRALELLKFHFIEFTK